jgi:hypothetical protein
MPGIDQHLSETRPVDINVGDNPKILAAIQIRKGDCACLQGLTSILSCCNSHDLFCGALSSDFWGINSAQAYWHILADKWFITEKVHSYSVSVIHTHYPLERKARLGLAQANYSRGRRNSS